MLPLDWMFEGLVLTNNSGVHSKKAGEYGLDECFNASKSHTKNHVQIKKIKNLYLCLALPLPVKQL